MVAVQYLISSSFLLSFLDKLLFVVWNLLLYLYLILLMVEHLLILMAFFL